MLKTFWLVLGYPCNNRCSGCYAADAKFNSPFMPIGYAQEVIQCMADGGVKKCLLIGGEPTLHPYLLEIVRFASNHGVTTTLVTNGRRLSSASLLNNLVLAGLAKVVISLQGSCGVVHNAITDTNSFTDTVSGIANCVNGSVNLGTVTTISEQNAEDCPFIPRVLHEIGVRDISFNCGIPPIGDVCRGTTKLLSPEAIAAVITAIYCRAKSQGLLVTFNTTIPLCLFDGKLLENMEQDKAILAGCQMFYGRGVVFDPRGNILPCTHFTGSPLLTGALGDDGSFVFRDTFFRWWQESEVANLFRQTLWRYPAAACQYCCYWGRCIGGCPLFWTKYDPCLYIKRPFTQKGGYENGCHSSVVGVEG